MWEVYKKGFKAYLQLERSLSGHSVEAYLGDVDKLTQYLQFTGHLRKPEELATDDLRLFLQWIASLHMTPSTQGRILSGLRSFYRYCLLEQIVRVDPTELLEGPKQIGRAHV